MARKQLNAGSAFDIWFGVLCFLGVSGSAARLVEPLLKPHVGSPRLPPDAALGFVYLGALVVVAVAFDMVRARTERSRACCIAMGALMAMAGALVIFILFSVLWFAGLGLLGEALPSVGRWLAWPFVVVGVVGAVVLPSYWSGWRYGAWGAFWGASATLLWLGVVFLRHVPDIPAELSVAKIAEVVVAMLVGALAGTLGAARFQRSLAREAAAARGAAAESAQPAG